MQLLFDIKTNTLTSSDVKSKLYLLLLKYIIMWPKHPVTGEIIDYE